MARELIYVPPVIVAMTEYLRDGMASLGSPIRVLTQIPNPRPVEFLRVLQVGSSRASTGHADVSIMVEAWAKTEGDAEQLSSIAYALAQAVELDSPHAYCPEGASGTIAAPYPLPDLDTGTPRMLFTIRLIVAVETL